MATNHIADFIKDKKFINAYEHGKKTGALNNHPGDIHFRAYIACFCAQYATKLEGDFIECGVGKGMMSTTICHYVNFNSIKKNILIALIAFAFNHLIFRLYLKSQGCILLIIDQLHFLKSNIS